MRSTTGYRLLAAGAGLCLASTAMASGVSGESDTVTLQGVFRDFRAANINKGGHPDFEGAMPNGRGLYACIAKDTLTAIGDPELNCTGHKVTSGAMDKHGRNIIGVKPYLLSDPGDTSCVMSATNDAAVTSALSFSQWYNETPAAMGSYMVGITLTKQGNMYGFDGEPRKEFDKTVGSGANKNWGFTFELELDFFYDQSRHDTIECAADDAMWVYVDGKLVIDLGGAHDKMAQVFEVNRMIGLVNGKKYQMKVFYAERHKTDSWLKFQTSLTPAAVHPPSVSGNFD
jgi:fibro-slime domain-containing protein